MNAPKINKELSKYINSNVFIANLNIPLFENNYNSSEFDHENFDSINERLYVLLKLPHREFWCHILYDQSILQSLQSFLANAKRPYELMLANNTLSPSEKEIYKLYFRLVLRISTHKEVDIPEFTSINFSTLVYENYILDVPSIFDICSIFGEDNSELISKLLCGILSCQPMYNDDIKDYISSTIRLLNEKMQNLSSTDITNSEESTKSKVNKHLLKKRSQSNEEIVDLLHYLIDFSRTWSIFLRCVESKTEIFDFLIETQFLKIVERLFEKIVPLTQKELDKFETKEPETMKLLLSIFCYYMIEVWRIIFKKVYLSKLENEIRSSEENYSVIEECITTISSSQEHPTFTDAMYLVYPVEEDMNAVSRKMKSDKNEYYSDYVNETLNEIRNKIRSRNTLFSCQSYDVNGISSQSLATNNDFENGDNSDIIHVMDIYQDLTAQDIRAYMKTYSCTSECMLESLLDSAIDVAFVKEVAANSLVTDQPPSESEDDFILTSVLNNHRNIYDGDEFDTGKISRSQLHQGKKPSNYNPNIDPELRNMILGIVARQNEEEEDTRIMLIENNLYNDEFDDVYGISHDVMVNERDTEEVAEVTNDYGAKRNEQVNGVIERAHRITDKGQSRPGTSNGAGALAPLVEDTKNTLMEPSDVRYSQYSKNQHTKKRFQDNRHTAGAGVHSNRQGSHGGVAPLPKKDHRPKNARTNEN